MLWQVATVSFDTSALRASIVGAFGMAPNDPSERIDYLVYVSFCGIVSLVAVAFAAREQPWKFLSGKSSLLTDLAAAAGLIAIFFTIEWLDVTTKTVRNTFAPFDNVSRERFTFTNVATSAIALSAGYLIFKERLSNRILGWIAVVAVGLYVSSFTIVSNADWIIYSYHLEPLLHPIAQVLHGAEIGVTTRSLYGMFPHFLEPYFMLFGVSTLSFSMLYSAVTAAYMLACYGLIERVAHTLPIRLTAFLALIYITYFVNPRWPEDPYPQLFFLRFAFPIILICLVLVKGRLSRLTPPGLAVWTGIFALGPLWNLESGLITLVAFTAVFWVSVVADQAGWDALRRRIMRDLPVAILGGALALGLAAVYLLLRYGAVPELDEITRYTSLFTNQGLGFGTHPIREWYSPIILVFPLFAGTIIAGFWAAVHKPFGEGWEALFLSALLGLGLLAYWCGRSNMELFSSCAGPYAVIIAAAFVSNALRRQDAWWKDAAFFTSAGLSAFLICFAAAGFVMEFRNQQQFQYPQGSSPNNVPWRAQIERVEAVAQEHPGDAFIMSPIDALFYDALRQREPIPTSGFRHDMWKQDAADRLAYIRSGEASVIVLHTMGSDYELIQFADEAELAEIKAAIASQYVLLETVNQIDKESFEIYVRADGSAQ
ncbi:hypothetical protein ACKTEK_02170 [Tepidamorphus sp. 3E244]|uniref:hypothetical protein n=1 Tax=Tepidamorphus sp. 3E244 TaxID=3385498 RepID=UPI0038FD286D